MPAVVNDLRRRNRTTDGFSPTMTEAKNTPKAIEGWNAALQIADWLPGQLRTKAIEQINRQRIDYYRKLLLESRIGDKRQ